MERQPPSPKESLKARVDRTRLVDDRKRLVEYHRSSKSQKDWHIRCSAADRLLKNQSSKHSIVKIGRAWKGALSVSLEMATRKAIVLNEYFVRQAMAMQDVGEGLCSS